MVCWDNIEKGCGDEIVEVVYPWERPMNLQDGEASNGWANEARDEWADEATTGWADEASNNWGADWSNEASNDSSNGS